MRPRALERLLPSINVYEQQGKISACPLKPAEYATATRMGLGCLSPELFLAAITHDSASKENKRFMKLAAIGSSSMKMFVSEYFYCKYPRLPLYPLTDYAKLFLSPETVYDVAKLYGLHDIIIHDTVKRIMKIKMIKMIKMNIMKIN